MLNKNEKPTMPLLQHRFHCFVEGNFSEEEVQLWSHHVQSCDFDFKNNIITVVLYQSVDPTLYKIVEKAAHNSVEELIVSPHPTNGPSDCIVIFGIDCINHNMMFNYSGDEKVVHIIQFSYQRLGHEVRELVLSETGGRMKEKMLGLSEAASKAVSPKEALKKMGRKKK